MGVTLFFLNLGHQSGNLGNSLSALSAAGPTEGVGGVAFLLWLNEQTLPLTDPGSPSVPRSAHPGNEIPARFPAISYFSTWGPAPLGKLSSVDPHRGSGKQRVQRRKEQEQRLDEAEQLRGKRAMAENSASKAAVATDKTCGICLEDSKDPLELPCGHSKGLEDNNETSSAHYHRMCYLLEDAEERVGADWDGVTVLEDNNGKQSVLKWINTNRAEDRVNAISRAIWMGAPALAVASIGGCLELMTLLLQLGANINTRDCRGLTAIQGLFSPSELVKQGVSDRIRLLLSWGASFFPEDGSSREYCIYAARDEGEHELATLLSSELGGRRCEIVNLSSQSELNGKTCVADEYLPDSNQYKVTLETKSKEVLVLSPDNLKRRDRTPQDCGYYIEYKNGRTVRHDFDSSEDCQAFVAALNRDETQPVVTEEAEARAEQAAAELLAELGLGDSPKNRGHVKKSKKKKKKKKEGKKKKK
ncbi:hypothetical protein THAOC_03698 [Thalassiosira oceanica]|uniref:Uncharacterized protein n=1 Tax=Thalassiosira oceanica TaxID=159749 RepID=K0TBW6_THAOC|nr:hypothetical protein THAOC_03698 [Thalassiosira oceanica]|eukprot:EJK74614.1 hypothetical protein THAOC_03698 [Thalassiosira oceanica]